MIEETQGNMQTNPQQTSDAAQIPEILEALLTESQAQEQQATFNDILEALQGLQSTNEET